MRAFTLFDVVALVLAIIHFGIPLTYYFYMKNKYLSKPWNINVDKSYEPKVTIITPTYNEAKLIEKKLDNIYQQNYPKNKLEIIIVDSASTDETPELVKKWAEKHPDIDLKLVEEPVRGDQIRRKIRRAQHLILHFLKTKRYVKKLGLYNADKRFENIWRAEWWLHMANPWLLPIATILFIASAIQGSITALTLLSLGLALLALKLYRTWILQQLYLIIGALRNLWTKEIAWKK